MVFRKTLCQVHHTHVSVMRAFGKQVCNCVICFLHQVVYNEQDRFFSIKGTQLWKSLMKYDSRILSKHLLVLSVTVDYPTRWRIYHSRHMIYESKHKSSLATTR